MGKIKTTTCGTTKNTTSSSEMKHIFYSPNTTHEWFRFKKAFWSKIAVAGHGKRYLFRLTFSRIIFDLRDNAFPVSVRQTYWKKKNSRNSDDCLPINCLSSATNSVFSWFLLLSSSFNSKLSVNPSWVKWCIFKTSQKSHSLERAQEVKFSPLWRGEGQKSAMSMSSDICKFCTRATECQNYQTSGNGFFQSPSFPDHVTKKRRVLGTRMARDKRDWTLDMMKRHLILRVSFFLLSFCVVLFLAVNIMISWFVSTLELSARLQNTRQRIWRDWKTLENQSANLQANSGLEGILSLNAG